MANFYQLLNLTTRESDPSLKPSEVKAAYRKALLQYHPDKRRQTSSSTTTATVKSTDNRSSEPTVDTIALAYKTLSDPGLRAEYDRYLRLLLLSQNNNTSGNSSDETAAAAERPHITGLETVDLDDLVFDESSDSWGRDCRCGFPEAFVVTEGDLERDVADGETFVGCKGCSLWLRVLFSVDE